MLRDFILAVVLATRLRRTLLIHFIGFLFSAHFILSVLKFPLMLLLPLPPPVLLGDLVMLPLQPLDLLLDALVAVQLEIYGLQGNNTIASILESI